MIFPFAIIGAIAGAAGAIESAKRTAKPGERRRPSYWDDIRGLRSGVEIMAEARDIADLATFKIGCLVVLAAILVGVALT